MAQHPLYGSPDVFEVRVPVATVWTGPDAPRDIDALAVLDNPDVTAWTATMGADVRKGLNGRTLTQLLMGEAVQVLEDRGDWVRIAALLQPSSKEANGYPGWMRRAHLGSAVIRTDGATAFVMGRSATCSVEGEGSFEVSFGTALWVDGVSEESASVLLPDERRGSIDLKQVRLSHKKQQPVYAAEDLLNSARQFLGMRYLWGGTSSWGLDCSGLVHLSYRAHGVVLPRDACDQATADKVAPVSLDAVEPGDLYFFARTDGRIYHVGFVTRRVEADGTRWMLHAPENGELIEDAPMAENRVEHLVSAGRVLKPDSGE